MEHHTYAKSGSKKWSTKEKRDLVVQRIAADDLFSKYSPKHAEPWKKFKDIAKIGDFSEIALRKQWFSMVQRYRIHKANALGKPLNKQHIEELNKEWEYFGPIHAYMNQKTADLHSYALKEPNVEPPNHNLAIASVYSCDESQLSPLMLGVLNDHNFGERSPPNDTDEMDDCYQNNQNNNEELDRLLAEATTPKREEDVCMLHFNHEMDELECGPVMIGGEVSLSNSRYNDFDQSPTPPSAMKQDKQSQQYEKVAKSVKKRRRRELSEKDKYYRHRRGYERRMEKRLMGLCTVVGELLKQMAPHVDVQPLLALGNDMVINSTAPTSSDENDELDDIEDEAMSLRI